jgi:hypothetical protein
MPELRTIGARILELEREADPSGEWIPYCVRMKLDLAGLKIGLDSWQALPTDVRRILIEAPAETPAEVDAFAARLEREVVAVGAACAALPEHRRDLISVWRDGGELPEDLHGLLARVARSPTGAWALWASLDMFGRYLVHVFARKDDAEGLARALSELGQDRA